MTTVQKTRVYFDTDKIILKADVNHKVKVQATINNGGCTYNVLPVLKYGVNRYLSNTPAFSRYLGGNLEEIVAGLEERCSTSFVTESDNGFRTLSWKNASCIVKWHKPSNENAIVVDILRDEKTITKRYHMYTLLHKIANVYMVMVTTTIDGIENTAIEELVLIKTIEEPTS